MVDKTSECDKKRLPETLKDAVAEQTNIVLYPYRPVCNVKEC